MTVVYQCVGSSSVILLSQTVDTDTSTRTSLVEVLSASITHARARSSPALLRIVIGVHIDTDKCAHTYTFSSASQDNSRVTVSK